MVSLDVRQLIERVAYLSYIRFTYEPDPRDAHVRLVWSNLHDRPKIAAQSRATLHQLALDGYLAEKVDGDMHAGQTFVTYTMTAKGREAIAGLAPRKLLVHRQIGATDAELEAEGIE